MGICWGIVSEESVDRLDRWKNVIKAGLTPRLVVPVGDRGLELTMGIDNVESRELDITEILAEVQLLATDDLVYDQVEHRFDGYSVFLPDQLGPRPLPAGGFERNATACGAARLLRLRGNDAIDIQLRTAAELALLHGLAIEFSY